MPGPFDYRSRLPNPSQALLEGVQMGANVKNIRMQQAHVAAQDQIAEQAMLKAAAFNEEVADFDWENASLSDYMDLASRAPEDFKKQIFDARDAMTAEELQGNLQFDAQLLIVAEQDLEKAQEIGAERVEALRNSGREDEAKALEANLQLMDLSPDMAIKIANMLFSILPEGKEPLENIISYRQEKRAEGKHSIEIEQGKADVEATKAEIGKIEAETEEIYASNKNIDDLTNKEKFSMEDDLDRVFNKRTVGLRKDRRQSTTIQIASRDNSGQGDLSMIFAFMKMLDPTSVVREGEFATAANA